MSEELLRLRDRVDRLERYFAVSLVALWAALLVLAYWPT